MEVFAECRQPVGIVTKNRLITRDIDLLSDMAKHNAASVAISLTTLDAGLAAKMEPRASAPRDRLRAMEQLRSAGVPVMVMTAPIIPGLTDHEIPALLKAAADAGATNAAYVLLRLPHQVKSLFTDWLERSFPDRAGKVIGQLREARGGKLYESSFETRMTGTGARAEQIGRTFELFKRKYGLNKPHAKMIGASFRPPKQQADGQFSLFGGSV